MRLFILRYPGDPELPLVEMSRKQFQFLFPDRKITWTFGDGSTQVTPIDPEDIACDACSADPENTIYLLNGSRAYCTACYTTRLAQHCEEIP